MRFKKTSEETLISKYKTESFLFENLNKHFPQIDAKMWQILYHECFFLSFCIELVKKNKLGKEARREGLICLCNIFAP